MSCRRGGTFVCTQLTNLRLFGQHSFATKAKSSSGDASSKVSRPKKAGSKPSAKATSKEMANESGKDKRLQMLMKVCMQWHPSP